MQKIQAKSKRTALAVIALLALAAVFASLYFAFRPQPVDGQKTIHVEIIHHENTAKSLDINTNAGFLRQALEEKGLIRGDEGAYGLFVKVVDGVAADDAKQEWWRFTSGGEMLTSSVDATPVNDGDRYEITLVAGY